MNLILAPMLLSLGGGAITLLFYKQSQLQKIISFIFSVLTFISSIMLIAVVHEQGTQVIHLSNWQAPFGISYVADPFSVIMVGITGLITFGTSLYTFGGMDFKDDFQFFAPFFHFMMAGVFGAFLTGDLFNLYVCFELLLLASFVLISLGRTRAQIEGSIKYVMINLVSSTFFLCGLGLLYGEVGALSMAEVAVRMQEAADPSVVLMSGILFVIAFSIKAALFPFNQWLPSSYHHAHPLISGLFAGLLTKVGIYALLRIFPLILVHDLEFYKTALLIIAGLTMVTGVFGAAQDYNARRILSFHIISQLGYIALGVAIYTPFAIAATIFYFIHHIITKTNLFFSAGLLHLAFGHDQIKKMGGLYKKSLLLSGLFLFSALSLAGIPPLSGFFGKYFILKAAYLDQQWILLFTGILVGALTLFSMIKIWNEAFWKDLPEGIKEPNLKLPLGPVLATILFAVSIVAIGVFAEPLYQFALIAGEQIVDPSIYIQTVLGGR
jgi:multicomponent Na+:H+ antiporter subunit D